MAKQWNDSEAIAEFERQKAERVAKGESAVQAAGAIAKRNPALHAAYLAATQPDRTMARDTAAGHR